MRRGIRKTGSVVHSAEKTRIPRAELERADRALLALIDRDFRRVADRAGEHLRCAPACSDCCHGPFPVTRLDVRRLLRGQAEAAAGDPLAAACISERAADAVAALTSEFPGDATRGELRATPAVLDEFLARHSALACPALDPESGRCELYEWRPVACRTYGPPIRYGELHVEPCPLCFEAADTETTERCRLETDRDGLEQALLEAMGVPAGEEWETLIAFVLAERRR